MLIYPDLLVNLHNRMYRSGFSSLLLLEETHGTLFYGNIFRPYNPFFETFNMDIYRMIASGLTQYWSDKYLRPKGDKLKSKDVEPQVLTMEHLDICFIICLICLAISVLVFILELITGMINKKIIQRHKEKLITRKSSRIKISSTWKPKKK